MSRLSTFLSPAGAQLAVKPAAPSRQTPVEEVRRLKRIVMVGVYGAIFGFIPFYAFVLHYTVIQLVIGTIVGMAIAVSAIEWAFGQMYKLRKRGSYPGVTVVEVGSAASVPQAAAQALEVTMDLLGASAAWLALDEPDGLKAAAISELRADVVRIFLGRHSDELAAIGARQQPENLPWPQDSGAPGSQVIIVPLVARRSIGLLGIIADRPGKDLRDRELLAGMGVAIGLTIENLRQRESLQDALSVLSATLDSTTDGILVVDKSGKIATYNRRFAEMWRLPEEVLTSRDDNLALSYVLDQVEEPSEFLRKITELYSTPDAQSFDLLDFKDGRVFERYSQPQTVAGEIVGRVWCFRDVTERKQSEQTIRHLAYHDALTDLPNRALFADRLTVALAQARRSGQKVAVVFLDIDRFKLVNDTLGHVAGDELLQAVARELSALVREGDTVARVGGDEFTLLLTAIDDVSDITNVAQRVLETVRQPRVIGEQELRVSASLGVAVYPTDGRDVDNLLRHADTAMYRAKQEGRDNVQTYTPAMSAEIMNRVSLETDLRRALQHEQFVVHFQAQVERGSWRITGAEALIRWHHPTKGLVHPADFIPVAEDTGLIVPIGEWVLRAACRENRRWQDLGLPPLTVTVNLSALQFRQANLVQMIERVLAETGLAARYLELEITEGTTMEDPDFAARVLEEIRAMGVGISIDDFGTGYSSLGYLKRFKIDRLKIDRSFVNDLTRDPNDAAIATAVIVMAHSLGLRVVAEGVETREQLEFLDSKGCDEFQGYLVSRPVDECHFRELLERADELKQWLSDLGLPTAEQRGAA
jgi:diguanylate cyclase (GGDEF)-like protein/PAS domain S-box-containing protein